MTKGKKFKNLVRARMARTGESFTAAQRNLEAEAPTPHPAKMSTMLTSEPPARAVYHENRRRFRERSLGDWKKLTDGLTKGRSRIQWNDLSAILSVLNEIGASAPNNHTHMPSSGGLDLAGARSSVEPGCIEIHFDLLVKIVRPAYLSFTVIDNDPLHEWAFFWLATEELAPSSVKENHRLSFEEVLELSPGEYVSRSLWDAGTLGEDEDGYEIPLPEDARVVTRSFRGSYLTVTKGGGYNVIGGYDGSHSRWGEASYREQIQRLVDELRSSGKYGVDLRG